MVDLRTPRAACKGGFSFRGLLMKKRVFYKNVQDGENKKTFLLGMLFSHKKKTASGYVDWRLFGLWKAKKKNHTIRYYICGLYMWKKSTKTEDTIKAYKETLEIRIKEFENTIRSREQTITSNFICSFLKNEHNYNLFYIQTDSFLLIFSKEVFRYDFNYIYDFFYSLSFYSSLLSFKIMSPDCALYKEHINTFYSDNVLLYKYAWRNGLVCRSVITKDSKNSDLYLETNYLGTENYQTDNGRKYLDTPRRKIEKGITVQDYLNNKTDEKQKKILKDFFDWLFEVYQYPDDKDKLDGKMVDCNLRNFLVHDGKFIPIDIEFEIEGGLSKDMCLWYALGRKSVYSPHYEYFLNLYGLKQPTGPHPFWKENKNLAKAAVLNKELQEKYFTEKYLIPEYD